MNAMPHPTAARRSIERPHGLVYLARTLLRARWRTGGGARWLAVCMIAGFAVSCTLVFTMAGGLQMFLARSEDPAAVFPAISANGPGMAKIIVQFYVWLALFACALTVVPLASLAAASARLGARMTERRLAVLRLIGLSSADVTLMTLLEIALFALLGIVAGVCLYAISLPAWSLVSFQGKPIGATEMIVPVTWLVGGCVGVFVLAIISAWWGLQRVRITPLGVARRQMPRRLRAWRLVAFIASVGLYALCLVFAKALYKQQVGTYIVIGIVFAAFIIVIGMVNVVAPWIVQLLARACAHLPSASLMCAMRKIAQDPRAVWRRVGALALVSFVGGATSKGDLFSATGGDTKVPAGVIAELNGVNPDIRRGVVITLIVVCVVLASQVLITMSSDVLERAETSQALVRMGAPVGFLTRAAWVEILLPVCVAVSAAALGWMLAQPQVAALERMLGHQVDSTPLPVIVAVCAGLGLTALAMCAVEPLRRRVCRLQRRRND